MAPEISTATLRTGITLSYAATGDVSGPAVVFLPGPTDSWRSYEPILEQLPSSLRAFSVSQRGHGDSDKPHDGYDVKDFADDIPALLDALAIEQAVLAGHSGSCLAVRRVAIDHPERVAGMVLEASPTTLRGNPRLAELVNTVVAGLQDPIDPRFARSFVTDTSADSVEPALLDQLTDELLKVPANVWKATFTGLLEYDDMAELERITAPALLVWGDADGLVDRDMQTTLATRIRSAELVVYSGVGHTPRWEDPCRFAGDVTAFVKRLPARHDTH